MAFLRRLGASVRAGDYLVNVCETFENEYGLGDLRVKILVVWYWQAD